MMFFGMGFGLLIMILFWGGLILIGFLIVKSFFGNGEQFFPPQSSATNSAREILNERYARGEISREEYESMLRDINT